MATADLPEPTLKRVRAICLSLPDAVEKETWGFPTFRIRDKIFASFGYSDIDVFEPGDAGTALALVMKAAAGEQESLLAAGVPFFRPKYVGHRGWIGVGIDDATDWDALDELVVDSYCETAPKTLARKVLEDRT